MPSSNQINPFNYNIDDFDSGFLGPITDTNFRTYLFTHNLPTVNSVIGGVLGGNPWQDRGTEYDVSQSQPNVVDVPNLQDVAQNPSLYNNLTNPRQVNLTNNLQNLNPEVQNILGQTTPIQAGLGQDATTLFNPITANLDLPSPEDAAQISSDINNFTTPRYDNLVKNPTPLELVTWNPIEFAQIYIQYSNNYDTPYGVPQVLKIGFVGNTESWVNNAGIVTTTNEIRKSLFVPKINKYGPNEMLAYSFEADELVKANTGLIQYSTGVQGDFRDQLLSRSLGVGVIPFSTIGSGINFKPDGKDISELDKIARKRRGDEVKNRVKLNFVDNTVGALNVSPFSLLAGGNLIQQNYTITVPKTALGKVAQFAADLAGFNLPTSIIPDDAFGGYGVNRNDVDITNDILDYTGSGQKSLLYNALYINKYGPKLESSDNQVTTKLGQIIKEKLGAGQAPNTQNYLTYSPSTTENGRDTNTGGKNSLIDNINQKVKSLLNKSNNKQPTKPGETIEISPDQYGGFYGKFEPPDSIGESISDGSGFNKIPNDFLDYSKDSTTYRGTPIEKNNALTIDHAGTVNEGFDWRKRGSNPFAKGLLKYTQELVNRSQRGQSTGYIGYFDSAEAFNGKEDYKQRTDKYGHSTGAKNPTTAPSQPSRGNTTRDYNLYSPGEGFTRNGPGDDTGGEFYCRSWSSRRKYHTWDNLVRSDGSWWRGQANNTNMTMNWGKETVGGNPIGMPKIAWNKSDKASLGNIGLVNSINTVSQALNGFSVLKQKVIPYMLSIENLAWKDAPQYIRLPDCEKGPNGGRIMWFPPYDIDFSDSTSVNWDTASFIGRGENIYTYNHTERSGTLDFKIVVDHPSVLNELKNRFKDTLTDEGYNSFFAGCDNETIKKLFEKYLPPQVKYETVTETTQEEVITKTPRKPKQPATPPPGTNNLKIYFENSSTRGPEVDGATAIGRDVTRDLLQGYEVISPSTATVNLTEWQTNGSRYPCGPASGNTYQYLNTGKLDKLIELAKWLSSTEDGKNYKIKVVGYTSTSNPSSGFNQKLGLDRAINLQQYLQFLMTENSVNDQVYLQDNPEYGTYPTEEELKSNPSRWYEPESKGSEGGTISKCKSPCDGGEPCDPNLESGQANSRAAKESRYAEIILEPNLDIQNGLLLQLGDEEKKETITKQKEFTRERALLADEIANTFITECDYFEQMKRENPFVYNSFAEKIKYFHPAFHAITPEGFNSRLTFLQQCTRQGPQIINPTLPSNMVFGRPPVCILRIGDFYYTKIIIDSMNINYDPIQWDLNPEGIGVQPMIAKISLGFKFIGGSSLGGPIKQLQNAVSYNFFANTGTYIPAQVLEEATSDRLKFIYGAFLTPEEADTKYAEVAASIEESAKKAIVDATNSVNTTAPTTKAGSSSQQQTAVATATAAATTTPPTATAAVKNPSDGDLTITVDGKGVKAQVVDPLNDYVIKTYYVTVVDNEGNQIVRQSNFDLKNGQLQLNFPDTGTNDSTVNWIKTFYKIKGTEKAGKVDCPGSKCPLFISPATNTSPNVDVKFEIIICKKTSLEVCKNTFKKYAVNKTINIG